MAAAKLEKFQLRGDGRKSLLVPIIGLWGTVALVVLGYLWINDNFGILGSEFYLVPWVFISSACVLGPNIYLYYIGKLDLFHPLTFAAWSYIFPAFVVGGLIISFGLVNPQHLTYIENPQYNLPLSLVYVSLGYLALSLGFALPFGARVAAKLDTRLPKWQWDPNSVWLPGLLLLFAGVALNLFGVLQGIMGYQNITETGVFDALLVFFLSFLSAGYILIWLGIFSKPKRNLLYFVCLIAVFVFLPIRMILLGSRSALLISIIPIAMAFFYTGRKMRAKHAAFLGLAFFVAIGLGMIYGSTFRNIRGYETRWNSGDYFGAVASTLSYLADTDPTIIISDGAQNLADRVENLSSLGVVVANYERLAPYEASYGLENNIVNDAMTAFIPRFVWQDKPNTSNARAYSALYFNYGDNSFAMSPFGDLLRNFGPIGVPIGMLILGIYLRCLYSTLIDTDNPALWKKVAYYPLLTEISYEAFYATMLPSTIRTAFVLIISVVFINFVIRMVRPSRGAQVS